MDVTAKTLGEIAIAPLDLKGVPDLPRARSVGEAAVVNAGCIVAFGGSVSAQDQEDILYSLQFAQRAASARADRYANIEDWYKIYVDTLQLLGWTLNHFTPNAQTVAEGEFEMAKAALKIMVAATAGPAAAVLAAAIQALEGMAKKDGFIRLFEHFGSNGRVGNFQLGTVDREASGALACTLGGFQISMKENKEKFLFFKWRNEDVKVWADAAGATFNRSYYAGRREAVVQRLGEDADKAIADIPLA
jgi:hypothetical protein